MPSGWALWWECKRRKKHSYLHLGRHLAQKYWKYNRCGVGLEKPSNLAGGLWKVLIVDSGRVTLHLAYLMWLEFLNATSSLDSNAKEFINMYIQQPLRSTLVHLHLFFSKQFSNSWGALTGCPTNLIELWLSPPGVSVRPHRLRAQSHKTVPTSDAYGRARLSHMLLTDSL